MGLFVSTTGSDVVVSELGITISHPTVDQALLAQFSPIEISKAETLTSAIRAGTLVWKKTAGGSVEVPTDYDQDYTLIEQENTGTGASNDRVVTFKDMISQQGLPSKSGHVLATAFSGTPKKASVVFSTPFTDTNYSVIPSGVDQRGWSIESQLPTGFVINANANLNLNGTVYWVAIKTGET